MASEASYIILNYLLNNVPDLTIFCVDDVIDDAPNTELVKNIQVARATRSATFSVAPGLVLLLLKIDSAANIAASILTTFKRCANR